MSSKKPSIPKGTRDFGPEQAAKRNYIIDIIKVQFRRYGFAEIQTPAMENLSVLTGKYGDEGDKLLFKILNSGDFLSKTNEEDLQSGAASLLPKIAEKGLRYDLTVPFARFVVQNQHELAMPFRRFQIQPVWRADRPQKGRYREFYQCDADIVGSNAVFNESELTALIHDVFYGLRYEQFELKINHRAILNELSRRVGMEGREMDFAIAIDKLDKTSPDFVRKDLVSKGADDSRLDELFDLFDGGNGIEIQIDRIEALFEGFDLPAINELRAYSDQINTLIANPQVTLDFSLARGLTYYTGMIFEVKATDVQIGSICGGGRYDDLTGVFGLSSVSGVGISFGLDRIYDVLQEKNLFPAKLTSQMDLLICHLDNEAFIHGLDLLKELRMKGITAHLYPDVSKLKKQLQYADKVQAKNVIIVGSEEIVKKRYGLKNMQSGDQSELSLDEIINHLQGTTSKDSSLS